MLSTRRLLLKPTKHRSRHRSLHKNKHQLLKLNTRTSRIIHARIHSSNKINPLKNEKLSSGTTTDNDLHLSERLGQKSAGELRSPRQSQSILTEVSKPRFFLSTSNDVSTTKAINLQMSSSDFNSNVFNDRSIDTIYSCPNQTSSHRNYSEISSSKRTPKNCGGYSWLCTPCCTIMSLLAALLLAIVIATVLIALLVKNKPSTSISTSTSSTASSTSSTTSSTSTTTPMICGFSCLNQTWISSSNLLAKWAFNGTFFDGMNTYTAIAVNNPSFTTNGYVDQAIVLNAASNQYLYTSYIPLISASFTVELWLYSTGYPNPTDHSILGLCTYPGNDQCLHITIRNSSSTYRLYMSFFGDNCDSNGVVPLNTWIHAAFVFDNSTYAMSIYLNGQLVGNATSALPLQGTPNIVTIGYIPGIVAAYGSNYFQGYIDQLTIANRAKSACEILDDATLATYYNFDNSTIINDAGPNSLPSSSQSVSFVSPGHSSQAISFNDSTSYLQIADLTGLGIINNSFSISLWIRPYSLSGTLVFVSLTTVGSGWCASFIGFATNGSIVAQLWTGSIRSVFGPALSTSSVWYHIVETWSSTNGLRLYINNVLVASDASALSYIASSGSNYVKLANRPTNACAYGAIGAPASFYGDMDDFRIYSRELTADDACALYRS